MCVYVPLCIHAHVCECVLFVCVSACMCAYVCACVHVCECACVGVCACMCARHHGDINVFSIQLQLP